MAIEQPSGVTEAADTAKSAARLLAVIKELAAELHPQQITGRAVTLDSSLERDLAFDSLGRVELLLRVERDFDVALPEALLAAAETPRDLLRAVLGASGPRRAFLPSEVSELALGEAEAAPYSAETLIEVLDWHLTAHPDRPHIQFYSDEGDGDIITYRGLRRGAECVAAELQQRGLEVGESVVIMLPTGRDYFFSFFGVLLAGGVPVPIYPPIRATQIEEHLQRHTRILSNCLAAMLITLPEAKLVAPGLRAQVETLRGIVTTEDFESAPEAFRGPALGTQDTAFLQYTSGSTGTPKGVVLTHANLLANIRAMGDSIEANPNDVCVSWLPLYHDMGLIGAWLGCLHYAALFVIMSPLAFLARPRRWLQAIHRHRGTLSAAPNFAYELCLRRVEDSDLEGLDLSCWRIAFNGAEPVSPETVRRFCDRFAKYGFRREALMPVYGLAESSVGLAFPPLDRGPVIDRIEREPFQRTGHAVPAAEDDPNALRFVACGRPLPGNQIRIVDPNDRELPERHEGRLQFQGPSATTGYFRNPEQTRRLFHEDWLDSEDLAYIAGGDIHITGRSKDVIIRGGRNVYPAELEETVGDMPDIRKGNVAVFGSPDPESGTERVVVLAETRQRDAEALARLRTRINEAAVNLIGMPPDAVVLAPPNTVPKTSSGKIRRAASREIYESGDIGRPRRAVRWQVARLALAGMLAELRRVRRVVAAQIFGGYAWALFGLLALIVLLAVTLLPPVSWRWAVIGTAVRSLARATRTPLAVQGMENLPPGNQPCLYVSNHTSYLDGYVMAAVLPRSFSFVAKGELRDKPLIRFLLDRIQVTFVERLDMEKGIADARDMASVARQGRPLMFFPEGTFTRTPGLLAFHMGAFVTAVEAGLPVVPIAIRGTRSILRSDSWLPRRGAIAVTIDAPIDLRDFAAEGDAWTQALRLRDAVRTRILHHCGEPDLAGERPPIWAPPTGDS